MSKSKHKGISGCVQHREPTPSTYSDILQVPTDLFDVNAAVKGHPATAEKPTKEKISIIQAEVVLPISLPLHVSPGYPGSLFSPFLTSSQAGALIVPHA